MKAIKENLKNIISNVAEKQHDINELSNIEIPTQSLISGKEIIPVLGRSLSEKYSIKIADIEFELFKNQIFNCVCNEPKYELVFDYTLVIDDISTRNGWLLDGYTVDYVLPSDNLIVYKLKK